MFFFITTRYFLKPYCTFAGTDKKIYEACLRKILNLELMILESLKFPHSSELTKNHQEIRNEQYEAEGGRMYETKTQMCPVQSFLKYIRKKNPNCDAFWQRPRDSFDDDAIWFEKKNL